MNPQSERRQAREPISVVKREDGRYDVIDGNAAVQAARLAGWTKVPVQEKVDSEHPIIKTLAESPDDVAAFTEHANMVPLDQLVSVTNQAADPRVLAGTKRDPRLTAAYYMDRAIKGKDKPREPVTVSRRPDGKYDVIDGNATVQAARLAGWTKIPIQEEAEPGHAAEDEAAD